MRVGLDFDNTIVCYNREFCNIAREKNLVPPDWHGGKAELREELRSRQSGEKKWQFLQGQVYGKFMHRGELFPEVVNFLLRLKQRGDEVFIVSHKTEFGHNDPEKIPLRLEAMRWMETQRFFGTDGLGLQRKHVFFASTREEKVNKIAELGCEVFVDDLWEVFAEPAFPKNTQKVLFGLLDREHILPDFHSQSWRKISQFLLGTESEEEIQYWIEYVLDTQVKRLSHVQSRANSQVFRFEGEKQVYSMKWYPDLAFDDRPRLFPESKACTFLREKGIDSVLQFVKAKPMLNLAIYRWIEGSPVTRVQSRDIEQALHFVNQLHAIRESDAAEQLPEASESCLSLYDLWEQIALKEQRLRVVANRFPDLQCFLEEEFSPFHEHYRKSSISKFTNVKLADKLPKEWQTLSPSDFGFHNALRKKDGSLVWFDFEYFGWDDPVKLICDFLLHPGFALADNQKKQWWEGCKLIYVEDSKLPERLRYSLPIFGMRWCLIMLNVFLRAEQTSEWSTKKQHQLDKAGSLLAQVKLLSQTEVPTEKWFTTD